jgi:hypothetical protein
MVIFYSYVSLPEGTFHYIQHTPTEKKHISLQVDYRGKIVWDPSGISVVAMATWPWLFVIVGYGTLGLYIPTKICL